MRSPMPNTKHKPDCQIYKAGGPGPNFYCDCQSDRPTPPAPTAEQVREARGILQCVLDGKMSGRFCEWPQLAPAIRTILAAFPELEEVEG